MWMSVLKALMTVILMQLATTLKGVTPALATLDTQVVAFLAQVGAAIQSMYSNITLSYHHLFIHQILMSVSVTMEVATTTAMTQMEVIHAPAMMATDLTVMDTHVMVG